MHNYFARGFFGSFSPPSLLKMLIFSFSFSHHPCIDNSSSNCMQCVYVWIFSTIDRYAHVECMHIRMRLINSPLIYQSSICCNWGNWAGFGKSCRQEIVHTPIHEVIFSTTDRPKLLSQVSLTTYVLYCWGELCTYDHFQLTPCDIPPGTDHLVVSTS